MRNGNAIRTAGAVILALAAQLCAGGFYLQADKADSLEARKVNAVLTVKAVGCHDPASAKVTATAIGLANGERRSIPLKIDALSAPGTFAIAQQWPKEGRWVIQLSGRSDSAVTSTLVKAGPSGVDFGQGKAEMRVFTADEVDAMLRE
jgi:hypothetical protein